MDIATFNATIKRWGITSLLAAKANVPTGTPDGTKFLRDDNVWTTPSAGAAAAGTLTGATLAAGVTASSLLSAAGGSFGTAAFTASGAYLAAAGTAADVNVAGTAIAAALAGKQATLVSATNIKTINGSTVLGSGDLVVTGSQPNIPLTNMAPTGDETITAGYSGYVSDVYDIASTFQLEVGDGAIMEIG